jgi:hypothetical protein
MTTAIKLIDVDVSVPDVVLNKVDSQRGVDHYRLEGPNIEHARERIEAAGVALGYDLQRTPKTSCLLRGEQRINLVASDPSRVVITVDDPEQLPFARSSDSSVKLGRFEIDLGAERIVPRRERHTAGANEWRAEWQIFGKDAPELSAVIVKALMVTGLQSRGTMAPRNGGVGDTWHSEAYSATTLVKARAKQQVDHVLLELIVIDETERSPR